MPTSSADAPEIAPIATLDPHGPALAGWRRLRRAVAGAVALVLLAAATLAWQLQSLGLAPQEAALPAPARNGLITGLWASLGLLLLGLAAAVWAGRALQAQTRRAAVNESLARVAERTGALVIVTDAQRRVVWANEAFTRHSGFELHEVLGRSPGELLQCERTDPAAVACMSQALAAGEAVRVELLNRSRDGREYWIDADIQPLRNDAGDLCGFVAVQIVITESMTRRLRSAALLAALPWAVVVHGQDGRVQGANPAARRLLGTQPGDRAEDLLRRHPLHADLAPLLALDLPVARTLRVGRGECGQLLGVDDDQGDRRWLLVGAEPLPAADGRPDGAVACYVDVTERRSLLDMLRNAAPARDEPVQGAPTLDSDLRQALARDELRLVYQPVLDLADERLTGVEALLRWHHPSRGEILPLAFIGLAQAGGLIDAIGDFVLNQACAQFAGWQRQWGGRAPPLLVINVSGPQLRQPGLAADLRSVLEAHGLRPEQLQLDLNDGLGALDAPLLEALRTLKDAGLRLALDDFGSGPLSLASLNQLPLDVVKIDTAFVAGAHEVEHHRVLIQATTRVARELGLVTVAEGIETRAQAALMANLGCNAGQGHLFGSPMGPDEIDRWIERASSGTLA